MNIPDEYMATVYPELWGDTTTTAAATFADGLAARGVTSAEELKAAVRGRKRVLLAGYDTAILEAVGSGVDFLLDAQEQKAARARGGHTLRQHDADRAMRGEAYRAFAEVAANGGQRKDAVNAALERIALISPNRHPDHKTVRAWWDAIAAMGCFKIQKRE